MINTYIGYSSDPDVRHQSTSGGVGSSMIKYLFESGNIQTAISFVFDSKSLLYIPTFIYRYEDYKISGSIYQEIKLLQFIRDNIDKIVGGFACFCLPCQAKAIRSIISANNHKCFILGLTCSSQQSHDATIYLLHRLQIDKETVLSLQYRGNGWPGGVVIHRKQLPSIEVPNNGSIWTNIFHSRLFIQSRCFYCKNTLNEFSDVSLADPWLKEYIETEKEGCTLLATHTTKGDEFLQEANLKGYVCINEITKDKLLKSQCSTIVRKLSYSKHPSLLKVMLLLFKSSVYRKFVFKYPFLFTFHCWFRAKWERLMSVR